jgi:Protein of unknown function (DUF3307)
MTTLYISLLLTLGFCHFLADYTWLSTPSMLKAKSIGSPTPPIFSHASVHAFLMAVVLFLFGVTNVIGLTLIQVVSHTIIDILKGKCNVWFPKVANPANKVHWILFGLDQYLHFIVIVLMVYMAKF